LGDRDRATFGRRAQEIETHLDLCLQQQAMSHLHQTSEDYHPSSSDSGHFRYSPHRDSLLARVTGRVFAAAAKLLLCTTMLGSRPHDPRVREKTKDVFATLREFEQVIDSVNNFRTVAFCVFLAGCSADTEEERAQARAWLDAINLDVKRWTGCTRACDLMQAVWRKRDQLCPDEQPVFYDEQHPGLREVCWRKTMRELGINHLFV